MRRGGRRPSAKVYAIPAQGVPKEEILKQLGEFRKQESHVDSVRAPRSSVPRLRCCPPPDQAVRRPKRPR